MANEIYLTRAGYEKLKKELEDLKGPVRHNIADAIREAKSHGDLKENAAYHEAKLNQTRLESRIADLEKAVLMARVAEESDGTSDVALLGSKVRLFDKEFEEEIDIMLVGSLEADPSQDLISISSPLGEGVLGRMVGDDIEVTAPGGVQHYRILAVQ